LTIKNDLIRFLQQKGKEMKSFKISKIRFKGMESSNASNGKPFLPCKSLEPVFLLKDFADA